jgi:membrane-associated protease RseP (regulator of RpoE activity)
MDFNKIRKVCRPIRIVLGLGLIATGVILANPWFYLGVVPLIAGIVNFCPLCIITKKCDLPQNTESK